MTEVQAALPDSPSTGAPPPTPTASTPSHRWKDRPLPPFPSNSQRPRPQVPRRPAPAPPVSAVAAGKRRAVAAPLIAPQDALRKMLTDARMLAPLLFATSWQAFHALINTCQTFRRIFATSTLKNLILSRFVPGYRLSLGDRYTMGQSIDISLLDLAAFGESWLQRLFATSS